MTLTQLSYIVALDQHRNFSLAANAVMITQPTLSMQIQKLEEELGVVIFDRSQHPVRVTPVGAQVIAQARLVLEEAHKIHALTTIEQINIEGPLSIGVIPTLSPYVLPLFITQFIETYPEIQVSIEELQTQQIVDRIKNDQLDLGLLVTPLHLAALTEHHLFYEPFLLYVSPAHTLAHAAQIKEKDLSGEEVWLLTEGHCFRDQVIDLCGDRRRKSKSQNSHLRFESGNLETLKKMVDQGGGYTLLPLLAARDIHEAAKKKQLKEFQAPVPTREVSLVHSTHFRRRATVDALIELIQKSLPEELRKLKTRGHHRMGMPAFE